MNLPNLTRTTEKPAPPASQVLYWPVVLVTLAYGLLSFLLPIYARELKASAFAIGGLFTAFSITALVVRPLVGWGLDRLGRKVFLLAATVGYAISLAVIAAASTLTLMYVSRIIQGIASSLMWITAYTIATDLSPAGERGRSVALVDGAQAQGMLYGSIPGWVLLMSMPMAAAWPLIFGAYAVAALFATWLTYRSVPETKPAVQRQTSAAAEAAAASTAAEAAAGTAPGVPIAAPPAISPALYRLMVLVFITGMTAAMVAPIWMIFLQDHFTQDIETIVWAYLPSALVYSFLPARLGPLSDRFGRLPLMTLGLVVSGLVSIALPALTGLTYGLYILAALWAIEAVGFVMATPAQEALVADLTGSDQRGRGYGLYTFAAGLGAAAGPLLGGWLYDNASQSAPFYLNGAAMLLCAVLAVVLLRKRR